jgi:hypothetical protein
MRPLLVACVAAVVLGAAVRAQAVEGFVIGLDGVGGSLEVPLQPLFDKGVAPGDALLFHAPFQNSPTVFGGAFHFGWNFVGHAAVELALSGGAWSPFDDNRGGLALGGLRATWYPGQLIQPYKRVWDVGVELGGGYSIAGGPSRGMYGPYFTAGVSAEFYPTRWFSVGLFYRRHQLAWDRFLYHFTNNVTGEVAGYGASWGTPGLALNFHLAAPE